MSDVLDNSYQYNLVQDIQIQTIVIRRGPEKRMDIEIITEDGGSTPCVISSSGFSQQEIHRIMNFLTAAL
jgi:hypothetical protein